MAARHSKISRLPSRSKTREYDPLVDPNLALHFANPGVRRQLEKTGIVDSSGRILNPTSYGAQSRMATAMIEVKRSEAEEAILKREEAEIRRKVQHMKLQQLENERKAQLVAIMKEQEKIRAEIVRLSRFCDDLLHDSTNDYEDEEHAERERLDLAPHSGGTAHSAHSPGARHDHPAGRGAGHPDAMHMHPGGPASMPPVMLSPQHRSTSPPQSRATPGQTTVPAFTFPASSQPPVDAAGQPLTPHMIIRTPSGWIAQPIPAGSMEEMQEKTRELMSTMSASSMLLGSQKPGAIPITALPMMPAMPVIAAPISSPSSGSPGELVRQMSNKLSTISPAANSPPTTITARSDRVSGADHVPSSQSPPHPSNSLPSAEKPAAPSVEPASARSPITSSPPLPAVAPARAQSPGKLASPDKSGDEQQESTTDKSGDEQQASTTDKSGDERQESTTGENLDRAAPHVPSAEDEKPHTPQDNSAPPS